MDQKLQVKKNHKSIDASFPESYINTVHPEHTKKGTK